MRRCKSSRYQKVSLWFAPSLANESIVFNLSRNLWVGALGTWAAEGRRLHRARNRSRWISPPAPRGQALGLPVLPSGIRFSLVSLRRLLPRTLLALHTAVQRTRWAGRRRPRLPPTLPCGRLDFLLHVLLHVRAMPESAALLTHLTTRYAIAPHDFACADARAAPLRFVGRHGPVQRHGCARTWRAFAALEAPSRKAVSALRAVQANVAGATDDRRRVPA